MCYRTSQVPVTSGSSTVSSSSGLRRSLRFVDLLALGLNATVGSGIFLLPDDLFRQMGVWSPFAFGLCALALVPVAYCFADAARRTDATGGPFEYARAELGELAGYGVGWMCFVNAVMSFAAVASAAAAYAGRLAPVISGDRIPRLAAVLFVLAFGALNYVGARPGALAIRLFTVGKFAVLALLVAVLVPGLDFGRVHADPTARAFPGADAVASSMFVALFALQGFEVVGVPAGESHAPERRVPRAVLGTLALAGLLYVVVQAVLVFGFDGLAAESDAPLADAALARSPALGFVVTLGALVSTLGFVAGSALGTPRYLFAMASRGSLPPLLARLHPEFATPHQAIVITSVLAALLVLPFDYRTLIGMSNVAVAVQYGATSLAVLRNARRNGGERALRRQVLALLGFLVSALVWFAATSEELLFAASALGLGLALRVLRSWRAG